MLDWQTIVALAIVGLTLAIFLVYFVRSKKTGCGHACNCDHEPSFHRVKRRRVHHH